MELEGTSVLVNGKSATVAALPYLTRAFAPEDLPGATSGEDEKEQAKYDIVTAALSPLPLVQHIQETRQQLPSARCRSVSHVYSSIADAQ